jgi:hypothetical protein
MALLLVVVVEVLVLLLLLPSLELAVVAMGAWLTLLGNTTLLCGP